MKAFLFGWVLPVGSVVAWYTLSFFDINFGFAFLTREAHDFVFMIYADILGLTAQEIPILFLKAVFVDTLLVLAFMAFRRRKKIIAYWQYWTQKREVCENVGELELNAQS